MKRWNRFFHLPVRPLGADGRLITGSEKHIELSRRAATEGMVLLKNEKQLLPLKHGSRVALFGKASADYVKGGGGSGDVTVAYVRNLIDGMEQKEKEEKVQMFAPLNSFYRENVRQQYADGCRPGLTEEPELSPDLVREAATFTDTAIISICRFSSEAQEVSSEQFYLTLQEKNMIDTVSAQFENIVVVLNVGTMMDTSWFAKNDKIGAVLLAWQAGMEGGMAEADLLCGDKNPSGKLTDTFATSLDKYPSDKTFYDSSEYVEYKEDIYVGYRYFETIPGAASYVNYCFGYGLSYTDFRIVCKEVTETENEVSFRVKVRNIGNRPGKEVVQVYTSAPQGKLGKPARELKAFAKTRELNVGESQELYLKVAKNSLASYDDTGKVQKSAWILEKGEYRFFVGNSVRDVEDTGFVWNLDEDVIAEQLTARAIPYELKERMLADGTMETLPTWTGEPCCELQRLPRGGYNPGQRAIPRMLRLLPKEELPLQFVDVAEGNITLEQFMDSLSEEDLICLLGGQPNMTIADTCGIGNIPLSGIPNVMTADGPAGLRAKPDRGICTTAWPCAILLACSYDEELLREVGYAGALEVKENNCGIWLTPAINIHRHPLCGRNFEYFSEDPYISGKMGAAIVQGVQAARIGASLKHFVCYNKEDNRRNSDSRVSERAMREIYLKGFKIAIAESNPWTVMSSYNIVNGVRVSENKDLLQGILREEWGYQGVVTTDWWNNSTHEKEVAAGNDIRMPSGAPDELRDALDNGRLSLEEIKACAKRVLELILKFD